MGVYKNMIDNLKANPLFAMSLCSKELFHSNFWAWLIENDPEYATVFFKDFNVHVFDKVQRESLHRDITIITTQKEYFIVENKLKSIPREDQLNDYKKSYFTKGVLTGIEDIGIKSDGWSFISYDDIAKGIMEVTEKSSKEIIRENKSLIISYYKMLCQISKLLKMALSDKKTLNYEEYNKFHDIRLHDIYQKMCAQKFLAYFNDHSRKELEECCPRGYTLQAENYYTNGKAGIDIRYVADKILKMMEPVMAGVQIEHDQYRIVVQREPGRSIIPTDEVYQEFLSYGLFDSSFDRKAEKRMAFDKLTSMKPRGNNGMYNTYSNDNGYVFVYQYYNLDFKSDSVRYNILCNNIVQDMKKVSQILEDNSEHITLKTNEYLKKANIL